ncbi:glycerol-3-phosphate dehydrogenase/oxidase [Brevibacterium daeguense]|uniref:Glycerol-3-phosphate dehydrogenase n=1 Tax=Brevibacterium daeguense TaxID=909936 RepID=A0ABP8EK48_9MICO|nr:glycerol-3-phosphate dehydrogenase/oxidase [Brevibacterium daeguense]
MRTAHLNPDSRRAALRNLARTSAATPLDILVVGGGITGAGIAFDAATRGLDVGILEARDWASGTSSRSSKLVHGGLRYLEMLDFPLVAEALHERDLLLTRIAPHLVRPVSFVFPFETLLADRAYIGSGVTLYDVMAARLGKRRAVPTHRHLGPGRLAERFPGLAAEYGGIEYFDAQVDDARLTQLLVRSAVGRGALAANYASVVAYLHEDDQVVGVRARDEETGEEFAIRAHSTILATSVWTSQQQAAAGAERGLRVLASKGIHITVPRERIAGPPGTGVITRTDTSVLFIIPWGECWLIGTTDTPWHEDVSHPLVTATDIDRVLSGANAVLADPLTREDVVGAFAGLRPLLQPVADTGDSTRISREHAVKEIAPGLSAIAGGKLTTYRVMAADAVDFAVRKRFPRSRSRTETEPLLGAEHVALSAPRREALTTGYGWDESRFERLEGRYGSLLADLLDLIDDRPGLASPLPGAEHCVQAEVVYAARSEGAVHLEDVLHRRLRLEFEVADRGVAAARAAAELAAGELGWDDARITAEVDRFTADVELRRRAETVATDAEAVALLTTRAGTA